MPRYSIRGNGIASSLPNCTLSDISTSRLFNKCMWNITGRVIDVKELDIFMRCVNCKSRVTMTVDNSMSKSTALHSRFKYYKCLRNCSSKDFEMWWTSVVSFDDGTTNSTLCIEGTDVVTLFEYVFKYSSLSPSSYRTPRQVGVHNDNSNSSVKETSNDNSAASRKYSVFQNLSFASFKKDIENHIVWDCGPSVTCYCFGHLQENSTIASALTSRSVLYKEVTESGSVFDFDPHCYEFKYVSKCSTCCSTACPVEDRIRYLLDRLKSCSIGFSLKVSVRVIVRSKLNYCNTSINQRNEACGNEVWEQGRENMRKIRVQCSNAPAWQIEYRSMYTRCSSGSGSNSQDMCRDVASYGNVRLQCIYLEVVTNSVSNNNITQEAYNILKELSRI